MSGYARVDSVDALKYFRAALVKFAETANVALADAEGEVQRVLVWLETEAPTYWGGQVRKRHEAVEKAKDAVRQKKLFKSPTGSTQSAVEEEKQLRIAQKRLEEAEGKLQAVRRYTPRLQKEISIYKGGVQRLGTTVSADLPVAISRLDKMCGAIEAYANLQAGGGMEEAAAAMGGMARSAAEAMAAPDYSPLRAKTAGLDRSKAVDGDVRLESWEDGLIAEKESETLMKLEVPHVAPAPTDKVLIEKGAWESSRIFLERVTPSEGDSGWFIGRGDGMSNPETLAVPVASLVEGRRDLREALSLPVGFLVVVDMSGITAVINDKGDDVWASTVK
jgi:hypothetical protein